MHPTHPPAPRCVNTPPVGTAVVPDNGPLPPTRHAYPMQRLPLNEPTIAVLVDRFYDAVRAEPTIGPVFNAAIEDWNAHKQLLTSFWCSVALGTGTYRGFPMAVHRQHPIKAMHFEQWLALWRVTCAEVLEDSAATRMIEYAERIGRSLRYGLGLSGREGARPFGVPNVSG